MYILLERPSPRFLKAKGGALYLIESSEQNFKNVLEKLDGWVPVVHFDALNQEAPSRVDVLISNFLRKFYIIPAGKKKMTKQMHLGLGTSFPP